MADELLHYILTSVHKAIQVIKYRFTLSKVD
jgi:hypothetical protein